MFDIIVWKWQSYKSIINIVGNNFPSVTDDCSSTCCSLHLTHQTTFSHFRLCELTIKLFQFCCTKTIIVFIDAAFGPHDVWRSRKHFVWNLPRNFLSSHIWKLKLIFLKLFPLHSCSSSRCSEEVQRIQTSLLESVFSLHTTSYVTTHFCLNATNVFKVGNVQSVHPLYDS